MENIEDREAVLFVPQTNIYYSPIKWRIVSQEGHKARVGEKNILVQSFDKEIHNHIRRECIASIIKHFLVFDKLPDRRQKQGSWTCFAWTSLGVVRGTWAWAQRWSFSRKMIHIADICLCILVTEKPDFVGMLASLSEPIVWRLTDTIFQCKD